MSDQESSKFEKGLINRRVQIRSFDWARTLTGVLVKVERYAFVVKLDKGGVLCVLKHACSAIGAISGEEQP